MVPLKIFIGSWGIGQTQPLGFLHMKTASAIVLRLSPEVTVAEWQACVQTFRSTNTNWGAMYKGYALKEGLGDFRLYWYSLHWVCSLPRFEPPLLSELGLVWKDNIATVVLSSLDSSQKSFLRKRLCDSLLPGAAQVQWFLHIQVLSRNAPEAQLSSHLVLNGALVLCAHVTCTYYAKSGVNRSWYF